MDIDSSIIEKRDLMLDVNDGIVVSLRVTQRLGPSLLDRLAEENDCPRRREPSSLREIRRGSSMHAHHPAITPW